MKKFPIYERRVYESVDDKSLSRAIPHNWTGKKASTTTDLKKRMFFDRLGRLIPLLAIIYPNSGTKCFCCLIYLYSIRYKIKIKKKN